MEDSYVVLSFAILNGAVTVYGPWQRRRDAEEWARENVSYGWSVRPLEPVQVPV